MHDTCSKDVLSGAFVMQDPADAERRERQASKEKMRTPSGFRVVQPSKASEFRTHASDWGDPRRSRQVIIKTDNKPKPQHLNILIHTRYQQALTILCRS